MTVNIEKTPTNEVKFRQSEEDIKGTIHILESFIGNHKNDIETELIKNLSSVEEILGCCDMFLPNKNPKEWRLFQQKSQEILRGCLDNGNGISIETLNYIINTLKKKECYPLSIFFIQLIRDKLKNNKSVNILA